ncbi:MAG: hypothetical protein M3Z19_09345, partial [Chloroflexota bacterium]|nr:hypothetical protein [Chloroflexota bacterium]
MHASWDKVHDGNNEKHRDDHSQINRLQRPEMPVTSLYNCREDDNDSKNYNGKYRHVRCGLSLSHHWLPCLRHP